MLSVKGKKRRNYILAFPGMGKSYLAEHDPNYIDVDFGIFRDALGVAKDKEDKLLEPFANYIRNSDYYGHNILTNEPKLVTLISFNHMYLPNPDRYSICAEKLSVSVETIKEWVEGWARVAWEYHIPVTYLKVGLRDYLLNS